MLGVSIEDIDIKRVDTSFTPVDSGSYGSRVTVLVGKAAQKAADYLGDYSFQLIHMPGHTAFQTAVYIPQERLVFTSDNVFCRVQALLSEALPF